MNNCYLFANRTGNDQRWLCPAALFFLCFAKERNKERRLFSKGSAGKKIAVR